MPKSKRPYIPLEIRLHAALLQLGLDPATAELDHDPALELREKIHLPADRPVPKGADTVKHRGRYYRYIPDANDPRYLVWRDPVDHSRKTNGPGGEKRITTRGGDHGDAAHLRSVTRKEQAFRDRLLAKAVNDTLNVASEGYGRRKAFPSRPFPKRKPRA